MRFLLLSFCALSGLVAISSASSDKYWVIRQPEIRINGNLKQSLLGVVYGARQCGGAGRFLEWRMETCNTTDVPCQFVIDDNIRQSEVEYIPSADIEQLGFRVMYSVDGIELQKAYEIILDDSSVTAGVNHIFYTEGQLVEELKGKRITAQFILFRADSQEIEVCTEADFDLI